MSHRTLRLSSDLQEKSKLIYSFRRKDTTQKQQGPKKCVYNSMTLGSMTNCLRTGPLIYSYPSSSRLMASWRRIRGRGRGRGGRADAGVGENGIAPSESCDPQVNMFVKKCKIQGEKTYYVNGILLGASQRSMMCRARSWVIIAVHWLGVFEVLNATSVLRIEIK